MIRAIKTAAASRDERIVALIGHCRDLANDIAAEDVTGAAHILNAVIDLQRARPRCAVEAEDRARLERANA